MAGSSEHFQRVVADPDGNVLEVGDWVSLSIDDDGDEVQSEGQITGIGITKALRVRVRVACPACGFRKTVSRRASEVALSRREM